MLQPSTIKFLNDLQTNNNKSWFESHRIQYEESRLNFQSLVEKLIQGIASFDLSIAELQAKNCMFRVNRDVRFSKDKRPYKNNMAAYFNKAGKKGNGAGYYLHVEPGKSFAAGGIWMPEAQDLSKIRQEIDYNFEEWKNIIGKNSFKKQFEKGLDDTNRLIRPPKGYSENNPALHYIKMKSFVISRSFSDAEMLSKTLVRDVVKTFQVMKPVIDFLNRAVE